MQELTRESYSNGWLMKTTPVKMPDNDQDRLHAAWNLATLCIEITTHIRDHDFNRMNVSPYAREIIEVTNKDKRKYNRGWKITAATPFVLYFTALALGWDMGATPQEMKKSAEALGTLIVFATFVVGGACQLRHRFRMNRMRKRYIGLFQDQIAASRAQARTEVRTPALQTAHL